MVCENIGGALRPKKARRVRLSLESATTTGPPRRSLCCLSRLLALRPEIPTPFDLPQYAGTLNPGTEPVYQALRRFPLVEDDKCHTLLLIPTASSNIANLFPYLQQEPIRQTAPSHPDSPNMPRRFPQTCHSESLEESRWLSANRIPCRGGLQTRPFLPPPSSIQNDTAGLSPLSHLRYTQPPHIIVPSST